VLRAQLLSSAPDVCPALYPNLPPSLMPSMPSLPPSLNTIYLVNTQRLAAADGSANAAGILTNLSGLTGIGSVVGAVIPVEDDSGVNAAYQSWETNPQGPCSIGAANGVVRALANLVNTIRASRPTLKNVVIVGGDDQIPFARVADGAVESNERDYGASTFPGEENVLADALSSGHYLTDDPLTASRPLSVGSATLYVPQLALGRLVETPAQINKEIQQFHDSGGKIGGSAALSTGYSFLDGAGQAVQINLAKVTGRHIATLFDTTAEWASSDLEGQLLNTNPTPGIDSLNAHFDYSRALPAAGDASGQQSLPTLYTTANISAHSSSFTGRLLFSMGCHAGLEMNTPELAASQVSSDDWAKEFANSGAVWVANTGYGYADSDTLAYSARLMAGFADELDGNVSVGDALLNAKQNYSAGNALLSPYDIKALMESTFYGLPMYQLNNIQPATRPGQDSTLPTFTDGATGLTAATVSVGSPSKLTFAPVTPTGSNGTFYQVNEPNPQLQVTEFRPIEPLKSRDVTEPAGLVAHGAFIQALDSTDLALTNSPATSEPGVDSTANTVSTSAGDPFPATPIRVATYNTVDPTTGVTTQRQRLDLVLGQFLPGAQKQQRLYDQLTAEVLYPPSWNTNFTPPTLGATDAYVQGGQLHFDATIANATAAIKRVNVLYTDAVTPGTWTSLDLTATDASHFSATAPPTASGQLVYFVQAVDASGNVGFAGDKGGGGFPAVAPPTPPVITSGSSASFVEGTAGSFAVQAGGNPAPTVAVVGTLPAGLRFDATTNKITGTPAAGTAGVYALTVTAGTALAQQQQTLNIFVAGATGYGAKPFAFAVPTSVQMPSSPTAVEVPVALSWPPTTDMTVHYQTADKSALAGVDYQAASGQVEISDGATLTYIPITIDPDTQGGPNKVFTVKLSSPSGVTLASAVTTVTLVNPLGPETVSVDDPLVQPTAAGSTMTFNVSLSSPVVAGHTVSVPYSTVDGTARSGVDYTGTGTGSLVFTAGQSTKQLNFSILDASVASRRTFTVKLGKPTGATLAIAKATGTIAPSGALPKPYALANPLTLVMPTSPDVVSVPISLSWPSSTPVSVSYQTLDKTAHSGLDYDAASGSVVFAPGQTIAQIPLSIEPDTQAGPNLAFRLKLTSSTASLVSSTAAVTLVDPLGPMSMFVTDPMGSPTSGGVLPFVVSLSSPIAAGRTATVPFATANGSAQSGIDYTSTAATLTFSPGDSAKQVVVPILDTAVAATRTLSLKLGKPAGAVVTLKKATGSIAPG
jgi:hypothetical protein